MARDVIVFGDDGSPHSDRAWLWISNQRWPGWTVEAITAQPRRGDVITDDLPIRLEPWSPPVPRTADPRSGIGQVHHLHTRSDPRHVLATRDDARLIVVGPRGAHGQARAMFLGSTADHLLHSPPAPLVIASTPNPASRILVCTDGSAPARHALETFASLPLTADAEVWVIGVDRSGMLDEQHDDHDEIDDGVTAALETLAAFDPRPVRVSSPDADIAGRITEHAYALRSQLLVLGTHGRTGLARMLLGSTCHALTRTSPCPLLVVPPPAPASGP